MKQDKDNPKTEFIKLRVDKRCRLQLEELCENSENDNGGIMNMSDIIRSLIDDAHKFHCSPKELLK